jgi:hypothetical protein
MAAKNTFNSLNEDDTRAVYGRDHFGWEMKSALFEINPKKQ